MLNKIIEEDFNTLWIITESIYDTYGELWTLEKEGNAESPQYESVQNALESSLELEKDIYSRFPKDIQTISKLYLYFKESKGSLDVTTKAFLEDALKSNKESLVKRRIHSKLIQEFASLLSEKESSLYTVQINGGDSISLKSYIDCSESCTTDYLNTLLTILNEYLNDERFKNIEGDLWQVAYNCFFMNPQIEREVKDQHMRINPELYWQSQAVIGYYGLDENVASSLKEGMARYGLEASFEYIISNYPYNFLTQPLYYFMAQIVFRASALFLGKSFEEVMKGYTLDDSILHYQGLKNRLQELNDLVSQDKNRPQLIVGITRG